MKMSECSEEYMEVFKEWQNSQVKEAEDRLIGSIEEACCYWMSNLETEGHDPSEKVSYYLNVINDSLMFLRTQQDRVDTIDRAIRWANTDVFDLETKLGSTERL